MLDMLTSELEKHFKIFNINEEKGFFTISIQYNLDNIMKTTNNFFKEINI